MRLKPVYWSIFIFIVAQIITFTVIARENVFLDNNQIYIPPQPSEAVTLWPQPTTDATTGEVTQPPAYSSLGPLLIYFLGAAAVMGITLYLIPLFLLRKVLRAVFAFLFAWGAFVILILWLPLPVTLVIAAAVGFGWFFFPRIWLHNVVMIVSMVALAAVLGRIISPWTAMILLLALAIYDFLAVRFGYMVWMADKLTDSNAVPAFVFPRRVSEWQSPMKLNGLTKMVETKPAEREYSILGGGDIGFSLLLVSSVYFAYGFTSSLEVAAFSLLGLIGAYWIQTAFLKGKPMPALPPIAVLSLIGFLLVR